MSHHLAKCGMKVSAFVNRVRHAISMRLKSEGSDDNFYLKSWRDEIRRNWRGIVNVSCSIGFATHAPHSLARAQVLTAGTLSKKIVAAWRNVGIYCVGANEEKNT